MHKEAIEAYKNVVGIDPDAADAHFNLGDSYFSAHQKDSAKNEFEILKKLDRQMADQLYDIIK
jgi:tetratricopeptide (TPR) repeat protein